jgi:hypothetical protein
MVTAFLEQLRATKGSIVNIGSIQSFVALPNSAAYTTSKGGVRMLTKALAIELSLLGIRVNAIGPGFTATPLNAAAREDAAYMANFATRSRWGASAHPKTSLVPPSSSLLIWPSTSPVSLCPSTAATSRARAAALVADGPVTPRGSRSPRIMVPPLPCNLNTGRKGQVLNGRRCVGCEAGPSSEAGDDPVAVYMNLRRSFTAFAAARTSELNAFPVNSVHPR